MANGKEKDKRSGEYPGAGRVTDPDTDSGICPSESQEAIGSESLAADNAIVDEWAVEEIVAENGRRVAARMQADAYDPVSGRGSVGPRERACKPVACEGQPLVPVAMKRDKAYRTVSTREEWVRLRCRYDFEYWAVMCVTIRDKASGRDIPFRLNRPQRRVTALLEEMRLVGKPLRLIMLKARQWGGSTLVQLYMAWIQTCLRRNWNSLICAHVKDTAATIRGMYSKMLDNYPREYWSEEEGPAFKSFERSSNIRMIAGRGCRVTIASAENQDGVRGMDVSMAHLSEVAFWRDTARQNPEGFIRAVCGAVNTDELTLVALESTANGVGNYFHHEWLRAVAGESDKTPVFVPWYEIDLYSRSDCDPAEVIGRMDDYEKELWSRYGLTLGQIAWYQGKRREYTSRYQMMAEYPTTPHEAFQKLDNGVFDPVAVELMRKDCSDGEEMEIASASGKIIGAESIEGLRAVSVSGKGLRVWRLPRAGAEYVAAVDIGGRSESSDWSVVAVIDRKGESGLPETVAQWRGHCDHDVLAWLAARIAEFYNRALLAFESNTLETENIDGDPAEYILAQVDQVYDNLYYRPGGRIGFHTNRSTKTQAVNALYTAVRDGLYVERSADTLNEMLAYQATEAGGYGASPGNHDDMVMARAIALFVAGETVACGESVASGAGFLTRRWE